LTSSGHLDRIAVPASRRVTVVGRCLRPVQPNQVDSLLTQGASGAGCRRCLRSTLKDSTGREP
jgi:hypothetical protein